MCSVFLLHNIQYFESFFNHIKANFGVKNLKRQILGLLISQLFDLIVRVKSNLVSANIIIMKGLI